MYDDAYLIQTVSEKCNVLAHFHANANGSKSVLKFHKYLVVDIIALRPRYFVGDV